MGKSSPKPPATPDYTASAIAQGAANLEAAKQSAYMSNPNIYTPLGSQQVTWNKQSTTDQTAYNKAMEQFRADVAAGKPVQAPPDIKDFTVSIEQPTIRQELTPAAQKALEAQQQTELGLANLGQQAIGKVGGIFRDPFSPNLAPMQQSIGYTPVGQGPDLTAMGQATNAPGAEGLAAAPNLMGMGQAQGGPQAAQLSQANLSGVGGVQNAPQAGLFGFAGGGQGAGGFMASGGQGAGGFMAGGGPAAPTQIAGANLAGAGQVAGAPTEGRYGFAGANVPQQQLQQTLDTSRLAQMPVGAGMTAQQAILSRSLPAIQAQRAALENQLANQGLVRGGEAYNAAMSQQAQQENDIITQAALQGISVDAAMRQQGFGELQAQADLANQARQAQFGMGLSGQQLYNQSVSQNLQQGLSLQDAQNRAQQQAFQQQLASGQFGREGQQLAFQMGQSAQQAQNQAAAQNFAQMQAAQQSQNQAVSQNFAQMQAAQQAQNQAVSQNFQQSLAAQQAQNAAQRQGFEQALGAQGFNQQAILAQFGMGQQATQAANAALAQNQQAALQQQAAQAARQSQLFGQGMDVAGFYNQALAQRQAAAQQQYQMQLAAQNQGFNQAQAAAAFANQARQQGLAEQMALRAQPINEITALLGGSQVQMPQFQGYQGTQVAAAPLFAAQQAAGNFAQQNYGNQVSAYNAQMGLLGGLAGAGGMALGRG